MRSDTSDMKEEYYEVQKLVNKRVKNGSTQFRVKWLGYPSSQNTWEPEEHLVNYPELVNQYNNPRPRKSIAKNDSIQGKVTPKMTSDTSDIEEEYEVERVVDKQVKNGSTQFLVKWKGYPSSQNTWEPEEHLVNSSELVNQYNNAQLEKCIAKNSPIQDKIKPEITSDTTDTDEFEVERVVSKRIENGSTQFLVKWKGYPSSQNTWEPEDHLKNAPIKVEEFKARLWRKNRCYRNTFRSFENQRKPTGNPFERGLMPEKIILVINDGKQIRFLMKFLYVDDMEVVSADLAKDNCPLLVEEFCRQINYSM